MWEKPFKLYLGCKKRETRGTLLLLIKKNQFIRNTQLKINSLNVLRKLQFKDSAFSWGQRVTDVWNFIKLPENYLYDESIWPDVKTIQQTAWTIRCVPVKVQLPVASWLETADLAWHSVQHSNSITTRDALDGCLSDLHLPVWCIRLLSRNRTKKITTLTTILMLTGTIQRHTKRAEQWSCWSRRICLIQPGTTASANTCDTPHLTAARDCWVKLPASPHKGAASSKSAIKHSQHKSTFIFSGLH